MTATPASAPIGVAILPLAFACAAGATPVTPQQSEPLKPAIVIQTSTAGPVTVKSLTIPWAPTTFMAMESAGDSYHNTRTWPFAQLLTTSPLTLYGATIPAGNYALVFHPNTTENKGLSLEIRRITVAEFLEPGNALTRTPDGETVWKAPIRFETATDVATALKVDVTGLAAGKLSLVVRYGNRRLVKEFGLYVSP